MRNFLLGALFPSAMCLIVAVTAFSIGRSEGNATGYAEGLKHAEAMHECHTTDTRPCAFGPGIVGVQVCNWGDRWKPCEPDPKCCAVGGATP